MLNKIKKFLGLDTILTTLTQVQENQRFLSHKIDEFDKLKSLDIDVGFRGQCTVVLTGVFQGRGYVKFYDVSREEFEYLVKDYRERKKHSLVRNIDAPPSFYGAFDL
jgi:hypothetical protein